ncbi:MAG TPA: hypothetical protein VGC35_03020 [Allosphingosinicella sp.]|jgi:hypothetical protein
MKPLIFSLLAIAALSGCAAYDISPAEPAGFASNKLGEDSYELTYFGPWNGSRDAVEGSLLYRAARIGQQQGKTWFRFLHMPGEAGPLSHPGRTAPSFGAAYSHWQPHWSYRAGSDWQPWHPEWGTPFWADAPDAKNVKQVRVHAMIELGDGPFRAAETTDFEVAAVLKDLRPAFE